MATVEFKFNLGDEVEDFITGFKGRITCRAEYIAGCVQYNVAPRMKEDGKYPESMTFDEQRLKLVEVKEVEPAKRTGGPQEQSRSAR